MDLSLFWRFLHHFFAFSFVGSLVLADWNGRAARATADWHQRALLFQLVSLSSRLAGFGGLVLLGVFGNLLSIGAGWSMREDVWMRWINGVWILMLLVMALMALPNAGRLAAIARTAAVGGASQGYDRALARWRFANLLLSVLYVAMLVLMVFRWRS